MFADSRTGGTRGAAAAPGALPRLPLPQEPTGQGRGSRHLRGHRGRAGRPCPPLREWRRPRSWAAGAARRAAAPGQTMREGGRGRNRGPQSRGALPRRPFIPARAPPPSPRSSGPPLRPPPGGPAAGGGARAPHPRPLLKSQNFPQLRQLSCALTVRRPGLPRGPSRSSSAPSPRRKTIGGRSSGGRGGGGGNGLKLRRQRRGAGAATSAEPRSFTAAAPAPCWPCTQPQPARACAASYSGMGGAPGEGCNTYELSCE